VDRLTVELSRRKRHRNHENRRHLVREAVGYSEMLGAFAIAMRHQHCNCPPKLPRPSHPDCHGHRAAALASCVRPDRARKLPPARPAKRGQLPAGFALAQNELSHTPAAPSTGMSAKRPERGAPIRLPSVCSGRNATSTCRALQSNERDMPPAPRPASATSTDN
jgi:hypothetical protein